MRAKLQSDKAVRKAVVKMEWYRRVLKSIVKNGLATSTEKEWARAALKSSSRAASVVRVRNRCLITGRPRSVFNVFKFSDLVTRELAMRGQIAGLLRSGGK